MRLALPSVLKEKLERAPQFVKAIGDEILLATPVETSQECVKALRAFMRCLQSFNLEYQGEGVSLELKGAAWIAGFPINNHRLVVRGEQPDYIGPSIDVGFRLARFSSRRRLVVSVDLALLIGSRNSGFKIYYEGREPLKGVLGDRPYPIIWIDTGIVRLEDSLVGIKKAACPRKDLNKFCRTFIESCGETSWLIVPYLRNDPAFSKVPVRHRRILEDWKTEDEKAANIGIGSSKPKGGRVRDLIKLIEKQKRKPIFTDFEDEMGGEAAVGRLDFREGGRDPRDRRSGREHPMAEPAVVGAKRRGIEGVRQPPADVAPEPSADDLDERLEGPPVDGRDCGERAGRARDLAVELGVGPRSLSPSLCRRAGPGRGPPARIREAMIPRFHYV